MIMTGLDGVLESAANDGTAGLIIYRYYKGVLVAREQVF